MGKKTGNKKRESALNKNFLKNNILEFFEANPNKSFNYRQIAGKFEINDSAGKQVLQNILSELKGNEQIAVAAG